MFTSTSMRGVKLLKSILCHLNAVLTATSSGPKLLLVQGVRVREEGHKAALFHIQYICPFISSPTYLPWPPSLFLPPSAVPVCQFILSGLNQSLLSQRKSEHKWWRSRAHSHCGCRCHQQCSGRSCRLLPCPRVQIMCPWYRHQVLHWMLSQVL